ncbi:hypothetical protein C4580_03335 [Candidatus Woesearchaeota archaeon]|nr:MAG: hypothetical protein C4580_03335 [Candidatus Woesearchaeota archaeon]
MAVQIRIEKRHMLVFLLVAVLTLGSVLVIAFGGTNPAVLGHTVGELQGTTCPGTQKLTVDGAGALVCAADADTDTNTQCDDQNCGTIDVDGLQNSDSSSIAINSDDLSLGSAGGGLSREILLTNAGRQFSIRVDNSINNGNLIFRDATGGINSMRIREGGGGVDVFAALAVSSTITATSTIAASSGATVVRRCNVGGAGSGILTIDAASTCAGIGNSADTGFRIP